MVNISLGIKVEEFEFAEGQKITIKPVTTAIAAVTGFTVPVVVVPGIDGLDSINSIPVVVFSPNIVAYLASFSTPS